MSNPGETKVLSKVPITLADEMIQFIRLLALTGRKSFQQYLYEPLRDSGWERKIKDKGSENTRKLMDRVDRACEEDSSLHTVGPLCKRLITRALRESLSAVGDGSIFFLEKMQGHTRVAMLPEAGEFVGIIQEPLRSFGTLHSERSERIFEDGLKSLSNAQLQDAFQPVDLGRHRIRIQLEQEAYLLFEKIKTANARKDLARCRKLISAYLIKFADEDKNNRDQVEKVIDAFQARDHNFRSELHAGMALSLYYRIIGGITEGDLKKSIRGIRKYTYIFQGSPDVPYFNEIDNLERKLYGIIKEKDLWDGLKQ